MDQAAGTRDDSQENYSKSVAIDEVKNETFDLLSNQSQSCSFYPTSDLKSVSSKQDQNLPYVVILEQPISHTRFRFPSEKSVEKILGENTSPRKKTYPKIQVRNFDPHVWQSARVVVSCVSHNSTIPFIHPHNLVSPAKVYYTVFICLLFLIYIFSLAAPGARGVYLSRPYHTMT